MRSRRPRGAFLAMAATAAMGGALLAASDGSAGAAQAGVDAPALAAGTWHKAIELTGPAGRVDASITTVSCPSKGNCSAGGYYVDRSSHLQALVVTEHAGHWGKAVEVPGTAALNTGGFAVVNSMSCPSPGNCAANGSYAFSPFKNQMFVVSEVAGKWGQIHVVPGRVSVVDASISCASPGNCVTGSSLLTTSGQFQAFLIEETNGTWSQPFSLSGAGLQTSDYSDIDSVSCLSAGNCTATGTDRPNHIYQLFAVGETGGQWRKAVTIPLSGAIDSVNQGVGINTMSCASPGNCAAAGNYGYAVEDTIYQQPFVISETGGKWGKATDVPGLARPSQGGFGDTTSVSCAAPDTCTAGGFLSVGSKPRRAFLVTETGGHWAHVVMLAGSPALGGARPTQVNSVSCTAPGRCVAGGTYTHSGSQAFVVTEAGGRWGQARPVPGLAKLNVGGTAEIHSIDCSSANHCTATGIYGDRSHNFQAFAASES
ncbi:MAG TPA: hypothetical protein VFI65_11420 [Streptosporangiaceae bacterium]|nr:hypothetical protein [Streptosporangiaceae bacterium]